MNFRMRKIVALLGVAAITFSSATACGFGSTDSSEETTDITTSDNGNITVSQLNAEDMFSDRDTEVGYDSSEAVSITLSDGGSTCDSSSVNIEDNTITITEEGTYVISGSLSDGQIVISAKDAKVQLVLDNASISNDQEAAIYVEKADKVFITTADGSTNTVELTKAADTADTTASTDASASSDATATAVSTSASSDTTSNTDEENDGTDSADSDDSDEEAQAGAAIYSKADLTLNGNGTLTVNASSGNGIQTKDDLVITSGTYTVTAENNALSGKDSVRIADGTLTLTAGNDGIHSSNTDSDKGFVYIESGSITITSDHDGIDAASIVQIEDGTLDITSGGGTANAEAHTGDMMGGGMGGGRGGFSKDDSFDPNSSSDSSTDTSDSSTDTSDSSGDSSTGSSASSGDSSTGSSASSGDSSTDSSASSSDSTQPQMSSDGTKPEMSSDGTMPSAPSDGQMPDMSNSGNSSDSSSSDSSAAASDSTTSDSSAAASDSTASDSSAAASDSTTEDTESTSTKGIKSGTVTFINGGTITINSADDAIHSNGSVEIDGGTFNIAAGDDGMHADEVLLINSGDITVTESYEGLEGMSITVNDGNINVTSSDDGMNAAGGNDSSGFGGFVADTFGGGSTDDYWIDINGGYIYISAEGDGVDSNGNLNINGGELYVDGPTNDGNAAIDYGDGATATITGGTVVAAGFSGMAENVGDASTQATMLVQVDDSSCSGDITLTDSDGNVIASFAASKTYNCVLITSADIQEGETYTLTCGDTTKEVTMDDLLYSDVTSSMMH